MRIRGFRKLAILAILSIYILATALPVVYADDIYESSYDSRDWYNLGWYHAYRNTGSIYQTIVTFCGEDCVCVTSDGSPCAGRYEQGYNDALQGKYNRGSLGLA